MSWRLPLPLAVTASVLAVLFVGSSRTTAPGARPTFVIEETTIAQAHAAFEAGTLTCRSLVDHYLDRIDAYDERGPALHAMIEVNADATNEADRLDQAFDEGGFVGPLHCVPVVVKDNLETIGMPTTAGSFALKGFTPNRDATAVGRLRAAGAIILGKTNMAEFGLNPLTTLSSVSGETRNPYATDRVAGGSSGGTAAAVAANFALAGIGTDTGSSVRGPAAHAAIVGIRPTMGVTSRAGMVPLNYLTDEVGPMARTVEDAVALLDVIAGWDPADPATAETRTRTVPKYSDSLTTGRLEGVRLGVLRQAYSAGDLKIDAEISKVFARAIKDLQSLGAKIVDPVLVEQVPPESMAENCRGIKYDLDEYLAKQGPLVKVHSLAEILSTGQFHPSVEADLMAAQASREDGPGSAACQANERYRLAFAAAVTQAMDRHRVDAVVYPTWSQPPQTATRVSPATAGQTVPFASAAGFPAITVPMGATREVLPAGLSFLGRAWSDAALFQIAYRFEQATRHRRPPVLAAPFH